MKVTLRCPEHGLYVGESGAPCPRHIAVSKGQTHFVERDARATREAVGDMLDKMTAPDNNPKTRAGGMNKVPTHLVPPIAIAHMAMAFADGALKYQPYNWRQEPISASVYYGAALRHLFAWWDGEDYETFVDDEGEVQLSSVHHLAHAMACLAMVLDTEGTKWLNDNRPPSRDTSLDMKQLADMLPSLRKRDTTRFDVHDIAEENLP